MVWLTMGALATLATESERAGAEAAGQALRGVASLAERSRTGIEPLGPAQATGAAPRFWLRAGRQGRCWTKSWRAGWFMGEKGSTPGMSWGGHS